MIFKIIGALFIIGSTSTVGIYFSKLDKYRMEDLEQLKKAFTILKNQINFSFMPLPEALKQIALRVEGEISEILKEISELLEKKEGETAAQIWNDMWKKKKEKTYLSKEDIDVLFSFGKAVGYLDRQQQISNIEITISYIEQVKQQLEKRLEKNSKIYRTIGILSGLLIAIVLI